MAVMCELPRICCYFPLRTRIDSSSQIRIMNKHSLQVLCIVSELDREQRHTSLLTSVEEVWQLFVTTQAQAS